MKTFEISAVDVLNEMYADKTMGRRGCEWGVVYDFLGYLSEAKDQEVFDIVKECANRYFSAPGYTEEDVLEFLEYCKDHVKWNNLLQEYMESLRA